MKINKILVEIEGRDELTDITLLQREEYEQFLELMEYLRIGYNAIINSKN